MWGGVSVGGWIYMIWCRTGASRVFYQRRGHRGLKEAPKPTAFPAPSPPPSPAPGRVSVQSGVSLGRGVLTRLEETGFQRFLFFIVEKKKNTHTQNDF